MTAFERCPTCGRTREAGAECRRCGLAAALDHHWLAQSPDTGIARCTCGEWTFDARSGQRPLPTLGERFAPFSEHVADIVLAVRP